MRHVVGGRNLYSRPMERRSARASNRIVHSFSGFADQPEPFGVRLPQGFFAEGMDVETQERAFDPFFTTKDKKFSTGQGFSTVHEIVKQHGGHIAIYSEPGHGTTFKIYFPLVEEAAEELHFKGESPSRPEVKEVILLVEDEETVRNLACEALQMLGYDVLAAGLPEEAFAISADHSGPIDLLLTDVVLPNMDSKTCLKLWRR